MKADKFKVKPADGRRLDDGQWHDVYFTKRNRQVCGHFALIYSTVALVAPMSTTDVWGGIT